MPVLPLVGLECHPEPLLVQPQGTNLIHGENNLSESGGSYFPNFISFEEAANMRLCKHCNKPMTTRQINLVLAVRQCFECNLPLEMLDFDDIEYIRRNFHDMHKKPSEWKECSNSQEEEIAIIEKSLLDKELQDEDGKFDIDSYCQSKLNHDYECKREEESTNTSDGFIDDMLSTFFNQSEEKQETADLWDIDDFIDSLGRQGSELTQNISNSEAFEMCLDELTRALPCDNNEELSSENLNNDLNRSDTTKLCKESSSTVAFENVLEQNSVEEKPDEFPNSVHSLSIDSQASDHTAVVDSLNDFRNSETESVDQNVVKSGKIFDEFDEDECDTDISPILILNDFIRNTDGSINPVSNGADLYQLPPTQEDESDCNIQLSFVKIPNVLPKLSDMPLSSIKKIKACDSTAQNSNDNVLVNSKLKTQSSANAQAISAPVILFQVPTSLEVSREKSAHHDVSWSACTSSGNSTFSVIERTKENCESLFSSSIDSFPLKPSQSGVIDTVAKDSSSDEEDLEELKFFAGVKFQFKPVKKSK